METGTSKPEAPRSERPLPTALTDWRLDEFARIVEIEGAKKFHGGVIRRWMYERGASSFDAMSDLPALLRTTLAKRFKIRSSSVALVSDSADGTTKLLLKLHDDKTIESVIIPDADRRTLCVSTQVGCGVRCAFCASGLNGIDRNLTSGEIVEQFLFAREFLATKNQRITNVVLMGGGEPLNNFENVKVALDVLNGKDGLEFGARRITLSTIGIPAKIDRLEELGKQINLAISLHAPNEKLRGELMPGLDRVSLTEVLEASKRYFERTGREITFEYVVLKGVNDSPACARELRDLLKGMRASVNLIPLNPVTETRFERPTDEAVETMRKLLTERGINTTVRRSRGRDIDAACGQLRKRFPTGESLEKRPPGTR